jgi:cellulose synthase/poly-beta-1,6-N-acetylglucosamine synthase-like glycosyltransferase
MPPMPFEILFIISVTLMVYTYAGYPAAVWLLSRLFPRPVRMAEITPKISLIISAYNEERDIARKIENSLALDYPKDRLEIIVASDCSQDRTDEIVSSYARENVILHRLRERLGKTVAQNRAVKISTGEILVFSDATTTYEPDALRKIVRAFADPEVGCVTGSVMYVDRAATSVGRGARSYWDYEFFIKQCESRLGSLIGVCGCLYSVRRSSFVPLDHDMSSDFVIASEIRLQSLRTIYDPEAMSSEETNKQGRDEFRMRVRIIEQTMSAIYRYREVLSLRRQGMYTFQMISHKVLRYAGPIFLIVAYASNLFLVNKSELYRLTLIGQTLFYLIALLGWCADGMGLKLGLLSFPYYFGLSNLASFAAFLKFLRGEAHIVWDPLREGGSPGNKNDFRPIAEGVLE